ncbi:SRPBCC domain-containing protein [Aureibacillus halotolerans]|uniref:Activator of Hsp90 ATPase-like protein n=1 Tax=Aureibacillus halotolerans TaxID=1508390 RepID=A0A4R6U7V6_9BACI|nr:SRPBCC domain-containing protein [Aureibacillus halotolerans]TDQ41013.1 activator of Hsp90 ATPase-like protein [Aureibacillus halotolerans]
MGNGRIDSASRVILASPQTVYQAFLNPESLVSWLPPEGMSAHIDRFETRKGGRYRMTLTYELDQSSPGKTSENTDVSQGVFLALVPDRKIVWSIEFDSDDPAFSGEMIQTWYFEEISKGTKVTIVCENVPVGVRKEDHDEGLNSTLRNLATFTE